LTAAEDLVRRPADDPARRFADLVRLHGLQTKLIDRGQERHLLEEGVTRFLLSLNEARGIMRAVAESNDYSFESEISRRAQQILTRNAGRRGMISRKQFTNVTQVLRDFSESTITEVEARRQVKRIMLENGWRPKRAGLLRTRGWFKKIEV